MSQEKSKRRRRNRNAVIMIVVGLVMLAYCNRGFFKARETASWPTAEGRIISSEIKRGFLTSGRGPMRRGPSHYVFKAQYQYDVDGELYHSHRVSFLSRYISRKMNSDVEDKFAAGQTVDVFYNPDTPSESVLIAGVNKYNKNPHSLFGILLFGLGVFGLIPSALRSLKQDHD